MGKGGKTMKRILLTLSIFIAFITSANAGELYSCTDRDGNTVITSSPQDGMTNCALKDSYGKPLPEEPANEKKKTIVEKDNAIVKTKETPEASKTRINNCINCCNNKIPACYNYTADGRLCAVENQNCVATCNSEGTSPSSWSDCWSQSYK
jgi:Domain of unknown function (DUF4124)